MFDWTYMTGLTTGLITEAVIMKYGFGWQAIIVLVIGALLAALLKGKRQ